MLEISEEATNTSQGKQTTSQLNSQPEKMTATVGPSAPSKKNCRLDKVTELIAEHLSCLDGIILQEVRRKANIVADHLANYGIDNHSTYPDTCLQEVTSTELWGK